MIDTKTDETKTTTKMQAFGNGSRHNAEGIGMAGAVIATWALTTFTGVALPPEVTVAIGTMIGAIAARIKG